MNNTEEYVLWFLRGISAQLVRITITGAALLAAWGLVLFLTRPFRRRHRLGPDTPRRPGPMLAASFWFLVVPLAMLAAGHLFAWLNPEPFRGSFLRFWHPFWLILLGLRFVELLATATWLLVNRVMPIPELLRQGLWTILVLVTGLACLRLSLGVDITPILVSILVLIGALGFGLQSLFANLFAGISIQMNRTVLPGDRIRVGGHEGEVIDKNWRETRLRSNDGRIFAIPNAAVASTTVENFTRPGQRRRHRIRFVASFLDSPADVEAALLAALHDRPDVRRDDPWAPRVFVSRYLDFGIEYHLLFWTDGLFHRRAEINSAVQRRAWYQFRRHGVEIPFPISDKVLKDLVDVIGAHRDRPREADRRTAIAATLAGSRLARGAAGGAGAPPPAGFWESLATLVRENSFDAGELVVRQGENGHDLHVISSGEADVRLRGAGGEERIVARLGPSDIFGEMGLLLGLPRTATIAAVGELELLTLDEAGFTQLLLDPAAAATLNELAMTRWREDREWLEALAPAADAAGRADRYPRLTQFRQTLWNAVRTLMREDDEAR